MLIAALPTQSEEDLQNAVKEIYSFLHFKATFCPDHRLTTNSLFNNNYGFLLADPAGETMYQYANLSDTIPVPAIPSDVLIHDGLPGYITKTEIRD